MARPNATMPQAMLLARLFGEQEDMAVGAYVTPTQQVLIKKEWMIPTGERGEYPNGSPFEEFTISEPGLYALEIFLFDRRLKHGREGGRP